MNPPASHSAIADLEKSIAKIPTDYLDFLRTANGGEGFLGENYLQLWTAESLPDFNVKYEVAKLAPWLLIFGSNGGGEAFAFDLESMNERIVMVPFTTLDRGDEREVATTFSSFLERVASDSLF